MSHWMKRFAFFTAATIATSSIASYSLPATNTKVSNNCIALTFDDGPTTQYTQKILDTLKKYHVKATWFVMGGKAKAHPELVRAISAAGNPVLNHSWWHPKLTKISQSQLNKEVVDTNRLIAELTGKTPKCMRPPFGLTNSHVRDFVHQQNMHIIMWEVNSLDYERLPADKIAARILSQTKNKGGIVLMHDTLGNTAKALPAILEGALARGQCFQALCE